MTSAGQYVVAPEAVRSSVGNVGGLIMQAVNTVMELETMIVPPTSFATIGSAVASANTTMQAQQITALKNLLNLMTQVNNLVQRSVEGYDSADQAVAASYGGNTPTTSGNGIFAGGAANTLATSAVAGSVGGPGTPHSVSTVLGYLNQAGLTSGGPTGAPTGSPAAFANWLDASPDHQAALGVLGTYSGAARGFGDIPGGVQNGDMVVINPGASATDQSTMLGIVANNGQLYNNGLIQPNFGGLANLQVYRPMSA
ncbi:MAG TPA: FecR/PupR family sigma factor regulator [Pseudonocardiaceae bacterium]|jgi:hypothetical protein